MGWTGKFLGAFLEGLPGSIIGDVIEEANKKTQHNVSHPLINSTVIAIVFFIGDLQN